MLLTLRRFLGEVVKRRRDELAFSQEELARRAGVHTLYVSYLEQGSRNMNLNALDGISEVLGCKPSELFAEAELKAYHAAGEHAGATETVAPRKARISRSSRTPQAKYL